MVEKKSFEETFSKEERKKYLSSKFNMTIFILVIFNLTLLSILFMNPVIFVIGIVGLAVYVVFTPIHRQAIESSAVDKKDKILIEGNNIILSNKLRKDITDEEIKTSLNNMYVSILFGCIPDKVILVGGINNIKSVGRVEEVPKVKVAIKEKFPYQSYFVYKNDSIVKIEFKEPIKIVQNDPKKVYEPAENEMLSEIYASLDDPDKFIALINSKVYTKKKPEKKGSKA